MSSRDKGNEMQQNATVKSLSEKQLVALESLLAGSTISDAAKAAGVDRTTVHRWQKSPSFASEYNKELSIVQETMYNRLRSIAVEATFTVEQAIRQGDVKSALAILKGMGYLSGELSHIGSDNPKTIKHEQQLREHRQEREMLYETIIQNLESVG